MSAKRRAPQPPIAGPNPAVAPGGLTPKTSAPEGTSTPPVLAPSAVTAVIGRELASSSPKVSCPQHNMTLFPIEFGMLLRYQCDALISIKKKKSIQ